MGILRLFLKLFYFIIIFFLLSDCFDNLPVGVLYLGFRNCAFGYVDHNIGIWKNGWKWKWNWIPICRQINHINLLLGILDFNSNFIFNLHTFGTNLIWFNETELTQFLLHKWRSRKQELNIHLEVIDGAFGEILIINNNWIAGHIEVKVGFCWS